MTTRKMRMMAASLALVLCVSLYSAPRAKAVAVEAAAVSIGAAVLGSYLIATNLDLIGDTAETISNGVTSLVSDWVTATGIADSGDSWLSALGTAAQMRNPGVLIVPGALAAGCAAFVGWLTETFGLDEDGEEAVAVEGVPGFWFYNGVLLPDIRGVWTNPEAYPFVLIYDMSSAGRYVVRFFSREVTYESGGLWFPSNADGSHPKYGFGSSEIFSPYVSWNAASYSTAKWFSESSDSFFWSNFDILEEDGSVFFAGSTLPLEDVAAGQLELTRNPGFTNVANQAQNDDELTISTGLADALTLEDFSTMVPAQIATGQLTSTAELTQTGEGTNPEPDTDDEAVYPYFPVLSGIRDRLDNLGDSIVDGVMSGLKSLVVPDEAFFAEAVPALQETFQDRMGLLTFPISLLADFMGRLLDLSDQEPIIRWNSVSIYGHQLIAAGQYNLKDALKSAPVKQMYDIYMITVNAIMIFAFLSLCHNKYRKIMQN